MPRQMTLQRLEMAQTRTNYASHVSGKDILIRNSVQGENVRARRMTPAARPKHRKNHRSRTLTVYRVSILDILSRHSALTQAHAACAQAGRSGEHRLLAAALQLALESAGGCTEAHAPKARYPQVLP